MNNTRLYAFNSEVYKEFCLIHKEELSDFICTGIVCLKNIVIDNDYNLTLEYIFDNPRNKRYAEIDINEEEYNQLIGIFNYIRKYQFSLKVYRPMHYPVIFKLSELAMEKGMGINVFGNKIEDFLVKKVDLALYKEYNSYIMKGFMNERSVKGRINVLKKYLFKGGI